MMPVYSKICAICSKDFFCQKISTVFCSKKCANRSRSLPTKLKKSIIERSSRFTMSAFDNREDTPTPTRGYKPPGATEDNPLGEDLKLVLLNAKLEAEKRGIRLKPIEEDNLDFINTTDPAIGNADGFGVVTNENNNGVSYKKNGLRRIGGTK